MRLLMRSPDPWFAMIIAGGALLAAGWRRRRRGTIYAVGERDERTDEGAGGGRGSEWKRRKCE